MTVVMTGEGSMKIPPSIFKMAFYKLNCGLVDETYQSSNTCHEPYKHKMTNGPSASSKIESKIHKAKGLASGSVMLQETT
jgi:hypothetical protein